jgi:hypothetical protein
MSEIRMKNLIITSKSGGCTVQRNGDVGQIVLIFVILQEFAGIFVLQQCKNRYENGGKFCRVLGSFCGKAVNRNG